MEYYYSKNQHPDDLHILKQLGVIERSKTSISEDEFETMRLSSHTGLGVGVSESEDEILFEKDLFLKNGSTHTSPVNKISRPNLVSRAPANPRKSYNVVSWHLFLQHAALLICGLSVSIIGPTLYSLQMRGFDWQPRSVMTCVSFSAFGSIFGVLFGAVLYQRFNTFCVVTIASLTCASSTFSLSWSSQSLSTLLIFIVQGVSVGLIEKGVNHVCFVCWRQKYQVCLALYFTMSIGCSISPLFVSSILAGSKPQLFYTTFTLRDSQNDTTPPHLLAKRSADLASSNLSLFGEQTRHNESFLYNLTTIPTSQPATTLKAKKPAVADGTKFEPPTLIADKNKPQAPVVVKKVESTTPPAPLRQTGANFSTPMTKPSPRLTAATSHNTSLPIIPSTLLTALVTVPSILKTTGWSTTPPIKKAYAVNITRLHRLETSTNTTSTTATPESLLDTLWSKVLTGREMVRQRVNTDVGYAYVMVGLCGVALFTLYAVTCCFSASYGMLRRKVVLVGDSRTSADPPSTPQLSWQRLTSRISLYTSFLLVSGAFCFLSGGFEAFMGNLLVFYCGSPQDVTRSSLSTGVLATFTFWFGVSWSRLAAAVFYKRLWRSNYVLASFVAVLTLLGWALVGAEWSQTAPAALVGSGLVGVASGHLLPSMLCWFDDQLSPGEWFGTFALALVHAGRLAAPLMAAHFVKQNEPLDEAVPVRRQEGLAIFGLVWLMGLCLVTVFGRRSIARRFTSAVGGGHAARDKEGGDESSSFVRRIKAANGQVVEYRKHVNDDELDFDTD